MQNPYEMKDKIEELEAKIGRLESRTREPKTPRLIEESTAKNQRVTEFHAVDKMFWLRLMGAITASIILAYTIIFFWTMALMKMFVFRLL